MNKQKLKDGDFVKNLTETQFNNILKQEDFHPICIKFKYCAKNDNDECHPYSLLYEDHCLLHGLKESSKNELTYRQFLSRAKNTWKLSA